MLFRNVAEVIGSSALDPAHLEPKAPLLPLHPVTSGGRLIQRSLGALVYRALRFTIAHDWDFRSLRILAHRLHEGITDISEQNGVYTVSGAGTRLAPGIELQDGSICFWNDQWFIPAGEAVTINNVRFYDPTEKTLVFFSLDDFHKCSTGFSRLYFGAESRRIEWQRSARALRTATINEDIAELRLRASSFIYGLRPRLRKPDVRVQLCGQGSLQLHARHRRIPELHIENTAGVRVLSGKHRLDFAGNGHVIPRLIDSSIVAGLPIEISSSHATDVFKIASPIGEPSVIESGKHLVLTNHGFAFLGARYVLGSSLRIMGNSYGRGQWLARLPISIPSQRDIRPEVMGHLQRALAFVPASLARWRDLYPDQRRHIDEVHKKAGDVDAASLRGRIKNDLPSFLRMVYHNAGHLWYAKVEKQQPEFRDRWLGLVDARWFYRNQPENVYGLYADQRGWKPSDDSGANTPASATPGFGFARALGNINECYDVATFIEWALHAPQDLSCEIKRVADLHLVGRVEEILLSKVLLLYEYGAIDLPLVEYMLRPLLNAETIAHQPHWLRNQLRRHQPQAHGAKRFYQLLEALELYEPFNNETERYLLEPFHHFTSAKELSDLVRARAPLAFDSTLMAASLPLRGYRFYAVWNIEMQAYDVRIDVPKPANASGNSGWSDSEQVAKLAIDTISWLADPAGTVAFCAKVLSYRDDNNIGGLMLYLKQGLRNSPRAPRP